MSLSPISQRVSFSSENSSVHESSDSEKPSASLYEKQSPTRCLEILLNCWSSEESEPTNREESEGIKSRSYSSLEGSSKSKSDSCSNLEEKSKSESFENLLEKTLSQNNTNSPQRIRISSKEKLDVPLQCMFDGPRIEITPPESFQVIKQSNEDGIKKSQIQASKFLLGEGNALRPGLGPERIKKLSNRSHSASIEDASKDLKGDAPKVLRASDGDIITAKRKAYSRCKSVDSLNNICSPLTSRPPKNNTNSNITNTNSHTTNKQIHSFGDFNLKDRTGNEISLALGDEKKSARFEELKRLAKKTSISDHNKDFITYSAKKKSECVNTDNIEIKQGALLPCSSLYKVWHECFDLLVSHGIKKNATTVFTETLHHALKTLITLKPVGFGEASFKGVSIKNILDCITDIDCKYYNPLKIEGKVEIRKLNEKIKKVLDATFGDDKSRNQILALLNEWKMPVLPNSLKDSGKSLQHITCFEHLWHEPVAHVSKKLPPTIDEISYDEMINYYLSGDKLLPISITINDTELFEKPEGTQMVSMKEKDFLYKILSGLYTALGYQLDEKSLKDQIATVSFGEKNWDPTKITTETLTCLRLLKLGASWKRAVHYWMLRANTAENNPLNMEVLENISLNIHCDGKTLTNSYVEQIKSFKLCNQKEKEADQIKAIIPVSWKVCLPDMNVDVPMWHFCLRPLNIGLYDNASRLTIKAVEKYMSNFKDTPVIENDLVNGGIVLKSVYNNSLALDVLRNEILPTISEKSPRSGKSFIYPV